MTQQQTTDTTPANQKDTTMTEHQTTQTDAQDAQDAPQEAQEAQVHQEPTAEPADAQESPQTTEDQDEDMNGRGNREAAKYRRQLRDTEAERDALKTQLDAARWQMLEPTGKAEQVSSDIMRKLGHTVDEFVREDGTLDHDAYRESARTVADDLGIALPMGTYVPNEGRSNRNHRPNVNGREFFARTLAGGRDDYDY